MDLIPIGDNKLINVDRIDSIEVRKLKNGEKQFVIIVGGQAHTPDGDPKDLLRTLVANGAGKATNQFFSV